MATFAVYAIAKVVLAIPVMVEVAVLLVLLSCPPFFVSHIHPPEVVCELCTAVCHPRLPVILAFEEGYFASVVCNVDLASFVAKHIEVRTFYPYALELAVVIIVVVVVVPVVVAPVVTTVVVIVVVVVVVIVAIKNAVVAKSKEVEAIPVVVEVLILLVVLPELFLTHKFPDIVIQEVVRTVFGGANSSIFPQIVLLAQEMLLLRACVVFSFNLAVVLTEGEDIASNRDADNLAYSVVTTVVVIVVVVVVVIVAAVVAISKAEEAIPVHVEVSVLLVLLSFPEGILASPIPAHVVIEPTNAVTTARY
jgi:hypothetical protein